MKSVQARLRTGSAASGGPMEGSGKLGDGADGGKAQASHLQGLSVSA